MNFQTIHPVPIARQLLERAFSRARAKVQDKTFKGEWKERLKHKEAQKWDIVAGTLQEQLSKTHASFPNTKDLPLFYQKLFPLTLDEQQLRRSLAQLLSAQRRLRLLHQHYRQRLQRMKNFSEMHEFAKAFYGRISSVINRIDPALNFLERSRRMMKTFPDIRDLLTICIYGFPNVGKTTLLNALSGTRAKVAAYAFTTVSINVGYGGTKEFPIQMADVPGTLARPVKMNPIEQQADLVAQEVADMIVYVFDPTGGSGYSDEDQFRLLQKVRKGGKPVILYLSKQDLAEQEGYEKNKKGAVASVSRLLPLFTSVASLKTYLMEWAEEERKKREILRQEEERKEEELKKEEESRKEKEFNRD